MSSDSALTETDWDILRDFRLARLQATFPSLETCRLQLSSLNNDLLLICDLPTWHDLQDNLVDVRMASWDIVGACNLSIFADGHLVYCAMTQLSETLTTIEPTLESTALRLDKSMATATKPRSSETVTAPVPPSTVSDVNALPAFVDLMPLAQKSGIPIDRIAAEINQLGGSAGIAPTGAYITTDKDQRIWVKAYLQRLEADFLLTPSQPPAVSPEPATPRAKRDRADATQRNGKASAIAEPATSKKPKTFKDFQKAQGYAVTIGRFLEAQGWAEDNPLRAQVFEGIAALPDGTMPTARSATLPERALYKILSKYPASSRPAVSRGMIKVARETIGKHTNHTETALESTEV